MQVPGRVEKRKGQRSRIPVHIEVRECMHDADPREAGWLASALYAVPDIVYEVLVDLAKTFIYSSFK